ncbi:MAG: hypothetical protein KAI66_24950, partial [Lentisphaeria bacterium]|nr:hypothetical protein [Lentisphaeria bacterium]
MPTRLAIPRSKRGSKTSLRRFTLLEMLAVVIIMVIIVTISVPTFEKLVVGSGVDAGARVVGSQLRLARQYAISHRKRVALIMPNANDTDTDRRFRAIRTCIVDTSNHFLRWVPNTSWIFLAPGGVLWEIDDTGGPSSPSPVDSCTMVQDVPGHTSGSFNARAVIFKPNGRTVAGFQRQV